MMKGTSKRPDLEEQWLQDLVEKVVLQLNVKKEMDILSTEIPKEAEDIEYLRDKVAAARQQLNETENAIKKNQLRLAEPKRKLIRLQKERQLALEEYKTLKEKEKDIERKLSDLPKMKAEIRKLDEDVRQSSQRLTSLQANQYETLQRKERLEEGCKSSKAELMMLEEEISVMRNTRDILGGKRPDHFDADTFEIIHDDVEVTVENYINEVNGEIERIRGEISSLNERLDAIKREEEALLSKKRLLPETIEQLRTDIGEDKDRETLMAELERLEKERIRLSAEAEQKKKEIVREDEAIRIVDERLEKEGKINSDLRERHSYLIPRKQEMDDFENVADEIQRLKDEIQRLNLDSRLNKTLHKTISELNSDVEQTRSRLSSSLEEYNRVFSEFEREINDLLSS